MWGGSALKICGKSHLDVGIEVGVELDSAPGSKRNLECETVSLLDGLDCSSTLARPSPCEDTT